VTAHPLQAAAALLDDAQDVTLLAHVQPDADSLGSALALAIPLRRRGAAVRVSFAAPAAMPESLRILDVAGLVVPPEHVPERPEMLVVCDAADPARLGGLTDRLATAGVTIMIDHHVSNPGFGDVQLLDPTAEATVVVVRRLLAAMGVPLDVDVARCLYAGLVTDTQNFRAAGEAAHRLAAELVAAGVDATELVRTLMFTHPYPWLAALGAALQRAVLEPAEAGGTGLVHTSLPMVDVERFRSEDVDSVVDLIRTTAEAEVAAVFKQVADDRWVTSLRSEGGVDVADVARRLGGGGHPVAAGFTFDGGRDELLGALRVALTPAGGATRAPGTMAG
jgi:phosphoesterase RecJ-like protein